MNLTDIEGWDSFTDEEKEVLLDLGQLALDLIGIVEPTPFADSANAIISMTRGDWWGALLSGVGVIPYIGDLGKFGKISNYIKKIDRAIQVARRSPRIQKPMKAVANRILAAIRRLPADKLPNSVRFQLETISRKLGDFVGGPATRMARLDRLTDDMLRIVMGSTKNVGLLPKQNMRTIVEFFEKHGVAQNNRTAWANLIRGIDLHAKKAVEVVPIPKNAVFAQYVADGGGIGQWLVRQQGAVSTRNLGVSAAGRERKLFRARSEVSALKSKAASVGDTWTEGRNAVHGVVNFNRQGKRTMFRHNKATGENKAAEFVSGGGEQFFLPNAKKHLEPVDQRIRLDANTARHLISAGHHANNASNRD